jgi:hypothetical protein
MIKDFLRVFSWLTLAVSIAVLTGCASPAQVSNMKTTPAIDGKKFARAIKVEVKGGAETESISSSNVSNADLKAAIESSIESSGLFKSIVQGKDGDYELSVTVTQLNKPLFGASFTVTMETAWSLVKISDKSIAMRKVILSSHTASIGDAFVGVTRLRLAVEGAVQDNIKQGLEAISKLTL